MYHLLKGVEKKYKWYDRVTHNDFRKGGWTKVVLVKFIAFVYTIYTRCERENYEKTPIKMLAL